MAGTKAGARKGVLARTPKLYSDPPEQTGTEDNGDDGPAATVVGGEEIKRLGIPVHPDGSIAVESLTDKAKARLVKMLSDPAVQQLGVSSGSSSSSLEIQPEITGVLYDAIGSLAASIAVATGHTVDTAKLLHFTTDEKKTLAEPTAKVLTKYSASWARYQDEAALGILLLAIMQGKISKLERRPADVRNFPQRVGTDQPDPVS